MTIIILLFLAQSIDVIFLDIAVYIALCAVFDQLEASQDVISLMCPEEFHLPSVADWQIECWNCKDRCGEAWRNKCGGCKVARYCSENCQKQDWQQHKNLCDKLAAFEKLSQKIPLPSSKLQIFQEFADETHGSLATADVTGPGMQGMYRFMRWTKEIILKQFESHGCTTWPRMKLVHYLQMHHEVFAKAWSVMNRRNIMLLENQKGVQLLKDIKHKDLAAMAALFKDIHMKLILYCQPIRKVLVKLNQEKEYEGQPVCALLSVDESLSVRSKGKCTKVVVILVLPMRDSEVP